MTDKIIIKGAREHNLRNINLEIPKNKMVVFTGVSGSGKSSLAMDTLFAEGQRRYVESLSSYARQFLGMAGRPDVDTIEGLSPAIAISQSAISHNPRSTVGTVTEIYDYLRLLFARIGHPHCPKCGREIKAQTAEEIINLIVEHLEQRRTETTKPFLRFFLLSPVIQDKRGEFTHLFENLRKKGYENVRVDGRLFNLEEDISLIKTNRHNVEAVIDRLVVNFADFKNAAAKKSLQIRLSDSVKDALHLSDGLLIFSEVNDNTFDFPEKPQKMIDRLFSQKLSCPICHLSVPDLEPRLFSFNSPQGACEECHGLGKKMRIDTTKVSTWKVKTLERQYLTTSSDFIRHEIEKLMIKEVCSVCQGQRLKKEALSITVNRLNIAQYSAQTTERLLQTIKGLSQHLSPKENIISESIFKEIGNRLQFLISTGLDYITLDRESGSLAAGESQRIRLSSQIGSGLTGVLYILDEPTIGLHPRDNYRLIENLIRLKDLGNTLIIVEHDRDVIQNADWVVEFGPQAGKNGGQIVFSGTVADLKNHPQSLTGQYLSGRKIVKVLRETRLPPLKYLQLLGCQQHNLKNLKVQFPLNRLICITGVSGSGKSTLIHDTLYHALKEKLDPTYKEKPGKYSKLQGFELIKKVLLVDQSPVGRTRRSNPATYVSAFTEIRNLFSQLSEARIRGWSPTYFSFNTPGGRCEECEGQGQIRIEMQFLPDVYITCQACQAKRFTQEVLEIEYKAKNIADVLQMTVDEAISFFKNIPQIVRKLENLHQVGLGYLQLGQTSSTLSGGESQRLKISRELNKGKAEHTLYLLDEPTTGLHFEDLQKLVIVLKKLVQNGHTVIVIEHHPDLIKNADWIIDLGPEGGEKGGRLVASGTVDDIINCPQSYTGQYL